MVRFFCLRCRQNVNLDDYDLIRKNKRFALRGSCINCGSDVYKYITHTDWLRMSMRILKVK